MVKGALNNCIRFGLYNEVAGAVRRVRGQAADEPLGMGMVFTLGAAAGAVSAVRRPLVLLSMITFCVVAIQPAICSVWAVIFMLLVSVMVTPAVLWLASNFAGSFPASSDLGHMISGT